MFEFRVTKYDPAFRDARDAFTRDEWTSFSDIGRAFAGVVLSKPEYERVEDAYIAAADAFLREAGVASLTVTGLENQASVPLQIGEGTVLGPIEIAVVLRRLLREEFWCRLERADAFIHIGYDYYMYIGVPRTCPGAQVTIRRLGLFVETLSSPYRS